MALRRFPVEGGHVAMFARALGDTTDAFVGPATPTAQRLGAVPAPPTFLVSAAHHDPERRATTAAEMYTRMSQRYRTGLGLHAEQRFDFVRPVLVGDVLEPRARDVIRWTRHGCSGGDLSFEERTVDWSDLDGSRVATTTFLTVQTSQVPNGGPNSDGPLGEADRRPQAHRVVVVSALTRTQIVMYAGASGDFNPIHTDDDFAVRVARNPSVFAHGMLTMGLTCKALVEEVGVERIRSFAARFVRRVWPGDTLDVELNLRRGDTGELDHQLTTVAITTRNQRDEVVLTGSATYQ